MDLSRQEPLFRGKVPPILLIGAGATGFHVAETLVALGLDEITVYDPDIIEESNLNRSLYGRREVGQYKVDALKRHLERITPKEQCDIQVFNRIIDPFEVDKGLLAHRPIIINTTDNLYHHGMMLKKLRLLKEKERLYVCWNNQEEVPWLYISPRMGGMTVEVFTVFVGKPEMKLPDNPLIYFNSKAEQDKIDAQRSGCTSGDGPQHAPSIVTAAKTLGALTVQQIINFRMGDSVAQQIRIDLDTFETVRREVFPEVGYQW